MKDLKHLIYFEDLLSEANNELVKQASGEGKLALGYTCYFVPEVLLILGTPACAGNKQQRHRHILHDQQNLPVYAQHSRAQHGGRVQLPVGHVLIRDLPDDAPCA